MYWFWHSFLINWTEECLIGVTSFLWRKKAHHLRKRQRQTTLKKKKSN